MEDMKFESYKIVVNGLMPKRRETLEGGMNLVKKFIKEGRRAWLFGVWFDENGYNEKMIAGSRPYGPVYENRGGKHVLAENVQWM